MGTISTTTSTMPSTESTESTAPTTTSTMPSTESTTPTMTSTSPTTTSTSPTTTSTSPTTTAESTSTTSTTTTAQSTTETTTVVAGGYTQNQTEGGCCIGENTYHRYCACAGKALSWCQDFCDNDSNCKGYFEYTPNPYCRVSTTTTCPSECTGPWDDGKSGELCSTCTCYSQNHGGCFIKNSDPFKLS